MDTPGAPFKLGYVPGATPAKWARTWQERRPDRPLELVAVPVSEAGDLLRGGALDVALVRLPLDRDGLHVVTLYEEVPVVVVPKDHVFAALEEDESVQEVDLADEVLLQAADDPLDWASTSTSTGAGAGVVPGTRPLEEPLTTALAVELVAAGIGVLVVPLSLARLHHRKDLTYRPVDGAPASTVALAWSRDLEGDAATDADDFFGIVKGRTAHSSRGRGPEASDASDADADADSADGAAKAARAKKAGKAAPRRPTMSAQDARTAAARRKATAKGRPGRPAGGRSGRGRPGKSR